MSGGTPFILLGLLDGTAVLQVSRDAGGQKSAELLVEVAIASKRAIVGCYLEFPFTGLLAGLLLD